MNPQTLSEDVWYPALLERDYDVAMDYEMASSQNALPSEKELAELLSKTSIHSEAFLAMLAKAISKLPAEIVEIIFNYLFMELQGGMHDSENLPQQSAAVLAALKCAPSSYQYYLYIRALSAANKYIIYSLNHGNQWKFPGSQEERLHVRHLAITHSPTPTGLPPVLRALELAMTGMSKLSSIRLEFLGLLSHGINDKLYLTMYDFVRSFHTRHRDMELKSITLYDMPDDPSALQSDWYTEEIIPSLSKFLGCGARFELSGHGVWRVVVGEESHVEASGNKHNHEALYYAEPTLDDARNLFLLGGKWVWQFESKVYNF